MILCFLTKLDARQRALAAIAGVAFIGMAVACHVHTLSVRARAECINNLWMFDAVKRQWALENWRSTNDVPNWEDLRPYLSNVILDLDGKLPYCPKDGTYTLGRVGDLSQCSIHGHAARPSAAEIEEDLVDLADLENRYVKKQADPSYTGAKYAFDLGFTTPAYQRTVLTILLEEANNVARDLNLAEQIPIKSNNLSRVSIVPPIAVRDGLIGAIDTSNYSYLFGGKKFTAVLIRDPAGSFNHAEARYLWPISRVDTNAAFQTATQMMAAAHIDVAGLIRDCRAEITDARPEYLRGIQFVPIYTIRWLLRQGPRKDERVALVEFLEPTRTIRQLRCNSRYSLRPTLEVTNRRELMIEGHAPEALLDLMDRDSTNSPPTNHYAPYTSPPPRR